MKDEDQIEVFEGEVISSSTDIQKKEEDSGGKLKKLVNSLVFLGGFVYKFISVIRGEKADQRKNQNQQMESSSKQGRRKRRGQR